MGASSSVDEAQFNSLKNTVNSLSGRINALDALKSKVDNLSTAAASGIEYTKLAEAINKEANYRENLAKEIAKNPNEFGANLAAEIGKNNSIIENLNSKLGASTTLQDKVADALSSNEKYKERIRGPKGVDGNIGDQAALKSNLFDKGNTLWCADGELCQIPTSKKGVVIQGALGAGNTLTVKEMDGSWSGANFKRRDGQWTHFDWKDDGKNYIRGETRIDGNLVMGDGATINRPDGRMHIAGGELLYLLNKHGVIVGKEWGGNGNLSVQGDLTVQGRNILTELNQCVKVGDPIAIRSNRQGGAGLVQGSDATGVGAWEQLRIERR